MRFITKPCSKILLGAGKVLSPSRIRVPISQDVQKSTAFAEQKLNMWFRPGFYRLDKIRTIARRTPQGVAAINCSEAGSRTTMAILIAALVMASAMMIAAFHSLYVERRREIYRKLRAAAARGRFADSD